jgi:hypothetical protein
MNPAAPRFALALAFTCAVTALAAAPAAATPPTVEVEPFHEVEVVPAGEACAFDVTIEHDGTIVTTTFYDRDGTPIRRLVRWGEHFTETYSANGHSLTTISISPVHVDLATGEVTATGNQRHVTVPGVGVVFATAGHYVFVLGTGEVLAFSGLNVPPGDQFCAALSA